MQSPDTAKPATPPSEPASNIEQLGGRLDKTNTETLGQLQARCLRQGFALGYYFAATVAHLAFAVSR